MGAATAGCASIGSGVTVAFGPRGAAKPNFLNVPVISVECDGVYLNDGSRMLLAIYVTLKLLIHPAQREHHTCPSRSMLNLLPSHLVQK
jgi:hypothetical protein